MMRMVSWLGAIALATTIAAPSALGAQLPPVAAAQSAPARPREGLAPVPGGQLWFTDAGGAGQVVVFLHAATGSTDSWVRQVPAFTSAGYRVITYDRRGFGKSVQDAGAQTSTGADDLAALMDYLGVERFHLVSTAAGGFVGLDFAVSFPQRLRSLVVANTMGMLQDEEFLEMGRRIRPPEFNALPEDYKELSPSYRAENPEGTQRWKEIAHSNRPAGPAVNQRQRNRMTAALLQTITAPTLVIAGEADAYMPPPVMRRMAGYIKGAEGLVIPETSHSAFWEQPELFNRHVLAFLKKHEN